MIYVFIFLMWWPSGEITTAGPFNTQTACDQMADHILMRGVGWKGWSCAKIKVKE